MYDTIKKVKVRIYIGGNTISTDVWVSGTWEDTNTMGSADELGWAVCEWIMDNYEYDIGWTK